MAPIVPNPKPNSASSYTPGISAGKPGNPPLNSSVSQSPSVNDATLSPLDLVRLGEDGNDVSPNDEGKSMLSPLERFLCGDGRDIIIAESSIVNEAILSPLERFLPSGGNVDIGNDDIFNC